MEGGGGVVVRGWGGGGVCGKGSPEWVLAKEKTTFRIQKHPPYIIHFNNFILKHNFNENNRQDIHYLFRMSYIQISSSNNSPVGTAFIISYFCRYCIHPNHVFLFLFPPVLNLSRHSHIPSPILNSWIVNTFCPWSNMSIIIPVLHPSFPASVLSYILPVLFYNLCVLPPCVLLPLCPRS